jgi:broad specificity phosphatase PhoE
MMIFQEIELFFKQGLKGIILLRHAHRENIPPQSIGNAVPITIKGRQAAIEWGKAQCQLPFEKIESSEVLRCLQTAECIQSGLRKQININFSPLLGNPGTFVDDPKAAEQLFKRFTLLEILKNLAEGCELKGMHKISVGVHRFLNELLFREEKLSLLITHDSIMIPICCYLFQSIDVRKYAPDFLEYVLIFYDENQVYCHFRNETKTISKAVLKSG